VRFNKRDIEIIDKVKAAFSFRSDADAIRFILTAWWTSLGSDAVDLDKLSELLLKKMVKDDEAQEPKTD